MHLFRQKIVTINLAIIVLLLLACEEKKQTQEYVAKVGNSVLTKEALDNYLSEEQNKNKFKNEFIRQWVDQELLYLEAEDKKLTNTEQYLNLLETTKRNIAASVLLDNYFKDNFSKPTESQLNVLYESHKDSFVLTDDGFVLNIYEFNNEQSALDFRNLALQTDWKNAEQVFENDSSIVDKSGGSFFFNYSLSPLDYSRLVKALNPGEISMVMQKEPSLFAVVQMVKIISKDSVPEFYLVKDQVEEMYFYNKSQELYGEYMEKLYSKYNVELKKVDE